LNGFYNLHKLLFIINNIIFFKLKYLIMMKLEHIYYEVIIKSYFGYNKYMELVDYLQKSKDELSKLLILLKMKLFSIKINLIQNQIKKIV